MITQKELKDILRYNEKTGIFTWVNSKSGVSKNMAAGTKTYSKYIRIIINKKSYFAHRLAWLYVYGYFPSYIDHINTDKSDNRLCNLREATNSENQCNKKLTKNNTSGVKGVSWFARDNNWRARIQFNGSNFHLGYFDTLNEAKNAVDKARLKLHGEFSNHG